MLFVPKQGRAALFGAAMLAGILANMALWQKSWPIARYDALPIWAISLQAALLGFRLESWREVKVILLFHLTGTIMEIFKVNAGSWAYPEPECPKIPGAAVFGLHVCGSRLVSGAGDPLFDMHWLFLAATLVMFWRIRVWFIIGRNYWMPLPLTPFPVNRRKCRHPYQNPGLCGQRCF